MPQLRILILTAAFGEGHNSAAKNLATALEKTGAVAKVTDPVFLGAPWFSHILTKGYRFVTTHAPKLWHKMYLRAENIDFSAQKYSMMRKPEKMLEKIIADFSPDGIVCTYPLYPYFLERIFRNGVRKIPVFTMITDSLEINAAWKKAPTDYWLVTDPFTREQLIKSGMDAGKIIDTGFPVPPIFEEMKHSIENQMPQPFRILYFPTAKKPHVRRISSALLEASPQVHLTIVLGKNLRLLYERAYEIKKQFPGRVKLLGWTRRVPNLLENHHLVVGKAGGATVHEAIAASCPMLVHHLVPGQEEGNLRLLEKIGSGILAEDPQQIRSHAKDILADHGAGWKNMRANLIRYGRNNGGTQAANFILQILKATEQK